MHRPPPHAPRKCGTAAARWLLLLLLLLLLAAAHPACCCQLARRTPQPCPDPPAPPAVTPALSTGGAHVCKAIDADNTWKGYLPMKADGTPCAELGAAGSWCNCVYANLTVSCPWGTPNKTNACEPAEFDKQYGTAVAYLILLLWCFSGVGIAADVFMEAIAVITSKSRFENVPDPDKAGETKQVEITTWNATVANLTLMALGSSAPEILLSVIETMDKKFYSGALGPSTIVGSAAFNLLVILAVCVTCIPEGETRKIDDLGVFGITAVSSLFAYVWLIVILGDLTGSPNVVTVTEGVLTFAFFPILVIIAFLADAGYFKCGGSAKVAPAEMITQTKIDGVETNFEMGEVRTMIKYSGGVDGSTKDKYKAAQEAVYWKQKKKTRADYRIDAGRMLTGGKRVIPEAHAEAPTGEGGSVGFQSIQYAFMENKATIKIPVLRVDGDMSAALSIPYESKDGTAKAGEDYKAAKGTLEFKAGEDTAEIEISFIDDDDVEHDEFFDIVISGSTSEWKIEESVSSCRVFIISDDKPPTVVIAPGNDETKPDEPAYNCTEGEGKIRIKVTRNGNCGSEASVNFATKEVTATADVDYVETDGTLTFAAGEKEKFIEIAIIDDDQFENDEVFTCTLSDPQGAELGGVTTAVITIVNDDELTEVAEKVAKMLSLNLDQFHHSSQNYKEQFTDALSMPSVKEDGMAVFILHWVNLPWELFFAIIPPAGLMGGFPCFVISLVCIGLTTAGIGDLASLLGCSIGLKDAVTAITLVALGTSLPDTFASKQAALGDSNADASVGNVTGSNSVNVFLGLGMPWAIAALYWDGATGAALAQWKARMLGSSDASIRALVTTYPTGAYVVPAGNLSFSVTVFSVCAVICLATLVARRKAFGAELGGPMAKPTGVMLVFLWIIYVAVSSAKVYKYI